jgi:hypothetical protein
MGVICLQQLMGQILSRFTTSTLGRVLLTTSARDILLGSGVLIGGMMIWGSLVVVRMEMSTSLT